MKFWMKRLWGLSFVLAAATSVQAEWREARSPHFQVYGSTSEKSLRDFTVKLERFDAVLRLLTGTSAPSSPIPLRVYLVGDMFQVQELMGIPRDNVAGFYEASPYGPVAVALRNSSDLAGVIQNQILYHEYAHHLMLQYGMAAYPSWYLEGFAEFVGFTRFRDDGQVEVGLPANSRGYDLSHNWATARDLLIKPQINEAALYAEGWLLVHYLYNTPARRGQLERYLNALNSGAGHEEAAKQFGDLNVLNRELHAYYTRNRFPIIQFSPAGLPSPAIEVRTLTPAEAASLQSEVLLRQYLTKERVERLASDLERIGRQYPDDPHVIRLTAAAELDAGEDRIVLAEPRVDKLLAIQPEDPHALLLKGRVLLARLAKAKSHDAAAWAAARAWIVRASRPTADDPLILYYYYASFLQEGVTPTPAAQKALARAFTLLPQDSHLRLAVVRDLARRADYDDAIFVLKPLAYSWHDSTEEIRKLLAELQEKAKDQPASKAAPTAS